MIVSMTATLAIEDLQVRYSEDSCILFMCVCITRNPTEEVVSNYADVSD